MKTLAMILAVTVFSLAGGAHAATVNEREAAQRQSIRNGVEDGSLTGAETRRLRNQQIKLEHKEQRMRSDGELTPGERARLQHNLNANRAAIYRQRHDGQQRD